MPGTFADLEELVKRARQAIQLAENAHIRTFHDYDMSVLRVEVSGYRNLTPLQTRYAERAYQHMLHAAAADRKVEIDRRQCVAIAELHHVRLQLISTVCQASTDLSKLAAHIQGQREHTDAADS